MQYPARARAQYSGFSRRYTVIRYRIDRQTDVREKVMEITTMWGSMTTMWGSLRLTPNMGLYAVDIIAPSPIISMTMHGSKPYTGTALSLPVATMGNSSVQ